MFEIYMTIILAVFVWGRPIYKCVFKNQPLDLDSALFAPIAYFAFYLTLTNIPVDNEMLIYEGYESRLIYCFLIMHIIMFILFSILKYKLKKVR